MIKKRTLAVFAVICLFLLMCSCGNSGSEREENIKEVIAVDSEGRKYSALLGSDGFLLLGDKDFLGVCVEDENGNPGKNAKGEYVTRAEEFPDTLQVGEEIHTKFFRIEIPDGWTSESDELVKLKFETATITVNERAGYSVKECKEEIESLMSAIGEGEEEKVKLQFGDAVKLNYENRIAVYIFEAEGRTYFVKVKADEKLFEEVDFEEIINTIKFRKGE